MSSPTVLVYHLTRRDRVAIVTEGYLLACAEDGIPWWHPVALAYFARTLWSVA